MLKWSNTCNEKKKTHGLLWSDAKWTLCNKKPSIRADNFWDKSQHNGPYLETGMIFPEKKIIFRKDT